MAISTICPECFTTHRIKDSMRGKRIRCPSCQAAIQVDDASDTDEQDEFDEPETERPARKSQARKAVNRADLNAFQKLLIFIVRNPWVSIAGGFFGIWVPISFLAPQPFLVFNVLGILLCAMGCVVGIIMAMTGVAMKNPFEMISIMTVGAAASLVVPPQFLGLAGHAAGRAIQGATGSQFGLADTGVGGKIAVYCGIILVVLLAHVVGLSFALVSQME